MPAGEREQRLERFGHFYGEHRRAVVWSETNDPARGDPKRVRKTGWQHTEPLRDGAHGAAEFLRWGESQNPAIALRTSNLIAFDCDSSAAVAAYEELGLPRTLTAESSPGKRHFYFRLPKGIEIPKVCFRFEGGEKMPDKVAADENRYLVSPPATHRDGHEYAFVDGLGPGEIEIAEMPAETYAALLERAGASEIEHREKLRNDPGRRSSKAAGGMRSSARRARNSTGRPMRSTSSAPASPTTSTSASRR